MTDLFTAPVPADCFDAVDAGQVTACSVENSPWNSSFEGGMHGDPGVPGGFGAFFVFALLFGLVTFVWRISLARRVAERSGLDPDEATELAILGEHGLEAGYLAGHLRDRSVDARSTDIRTSGVGMSGAVTPEARAPEVRTAEMRLRELQALRDAELVTREEYDARRTAILDTL